MRHHRLLTVAVLALFLAPTAAAAPALDLFSGDLDLHDNTIVDVNSLHLNNALGDGNVSDTITLSSSATVDTGALSGTVTNDIDTAHLTTTDPLTPGNISDAYVRNTGDQLNGDLNITGTLNMSGSGALILADNDILDAGIVEANRIRNPEGGNIATGGDNINLESGIIRNANRVDTDALQDTASGSVINVNDHFNMGDKNIQDTNLLQTNRISDAEDTLLALQDNVAIQGHLNMSNDHIDNVRALNMNNPLADGNISNTISISGGFVSVGSPLGPGNISTSVAGNALTGGGGSALAVASDGIGSVEIAPKGVASINIDRAAVNRSHLSNGAVNGTHIQRNGATTGQVLEWGVNQWSPGTDGNASTQCAGSEYLAGNNTCVAERFEADTNTQLDDQAAAGNVDMAGNNITATQMFNMSEHDGELPACGGGLNGSIMYNASAHWGCDGTSWHSMY